MKIKELQKTVNISWSPLEQYPIYIAAGTAAQQFDSNCSSALEIYSTNFSDPSYDLQLKATYPSDYRFQKIIWSATGFNALHENGLIIGGCEGGHVMIYSVAKMLNNEKALMEHQSSHTGAVVGLDINPFQTNLLASCASESEIFIWDLNNTSKHMNPGIKAQPLEDVQNVAWNRQVQHILASVFSSRCVIWDLRKSEQIIKLCDTQSRVRWHAVEWHPDIATQIWLASEDDQSPVVQMWDLRYATAPAKTMQIHQRGVLGMSWCLQDSDLVVSCGKDNRIFCWNANTQTPDGEILAEVATTATWYSDVQWCPRNPALVASSSLDGNVSIYSLFGGTQQQIYTSNKIAESFPDMKNIELFPAPKQTAPVISHDLKRPPKWIKRPCGVSFGFGGKMVSLNSKSKMIEISQVITEPTLIERAKAFVSIMETSNYMDYCRKQADKMPTQEARYLWYFVKANFEVNPKEEILNLLGFNKEDMDDKFSNYVKINVDSKPLVDEITEKSSHWALDDTIEVDYNQSSSNNNDCKMRPIRTILHPIMGEQYKIPSGNHPDSLVTEALLTGNIKIASEICMEGNRTTEALIIASMAGTEFLTNVQNNYLQRQQNELSRIISAFINHDWMNFINNCTVDSWKEALVAALKNSEHKATDIIERLGDRLLNEAESKLQYIRNAMLCYICSGSVDKFISAYYHSKTLEYSKMNYKLNTMEMQELAELIMLISKTINQQISDSATLYNELIFEYSKLLASQGELSAAFTYILACDVNSKTEIAEFRDRLQNTINYKSGLTDLKKTNALSSFEQQLDSSQSICNQISNVQTSNKLPLHNYQQNWNSMSNTTPIAATLPTFDHEHPESLLSNKNDHQQSARPSSGIYSIGLNSMSGSGLSSRSKYILDPSVAPQAQNLFQFSYSNPSTANIVPTTFTSTEYDTRNINADINKTFLTPKSQHFSQINSISFNETRNYLPSSISSLQRSSNPPPGWNDPPVLKTSRSRKIETSPFTAPITHPIFGVDPNENGNWQQKVHFQDSASSIQTSSAIGVKNSNCAPYAHHNNSSLYDQSQAHSQTKSTVEINQEIDNIIHNTEPPNEVTKPQLPERYIYLKNVLNGLKMKCLAATNDPKTKRKFVDVDKRLENLYESLRDAKLTSTTIEALHQIIQCVQIGDYTKAMCIHTQIAFGSDFAQCAGFMPGLKVLLQSASDLHVYLQ